MSRPIAVEVFAGAGGMTLGFEQAGFDVLVAVDHDPVHLATHCFNFPLTAAICEDVRMLQPESIEAAGRKMWHSSGRAGEWDGTIDCLFGGPSCQGFSYMGKASALDERNDLVFSFASLVSEIKPKYFVLENVPGLLRPKFRQTLETLLARLRGAGYRLWNSDQPAVLDASDYGVPQIRRRVFLVGALTAMPIPQVPAVVSPKVTVQDALRGLPRLDAWQYLLNSDCLYLTDKARRRLEEACSSYGSSLRKPYALEHPRSWDKCILTGCQRTNHSPDVVARFRQLAPNQEDTPSRVHRLDPTGQSFTLRAGTGRDHGSYTAPRPVHPRQPRVVSVREAARLHSLPDWFRLHERKWHAHRQIGNSVPPRMAFAVASSIVSAGGFAPHLPLDRLALGDPSLLALTLGEAADYFGCAKDLLPVDIRRSRSPAPAPLP